MIRLVFRPLRRAVTRLGVVTATACVLVLALAWWAPVQRELDTAPYRYGEWSVQTPIAAAPADIPRIQSDLGTDVLLGAWWTSPLRNARGNEIAITGVVTPTPESATSIFPVETRIGYEPVAGQAWIDLDASAAHALGVWAGDTVFFGALEASKQSPYTVRGVYAVAPIQSNLPLALVSAEPVLSRFTPTKDNPDTITIAWIRGRTGQEVLRQFHDRFYTSRLLAGGYPFTASTTVEDMGIQSREEWLAQAERQSVAGVSIITGISLLAAAALLGILWREIAVFAGRAAPVGTVLHRLGASRKSLWRAVAAVSAAALVAGVAVGAVAAIGVLNTGWLTAAFPPTLAGWFWLVCGAAALAGVLGCAALVRARLNSGGAR